LAVIMETHFGTSMNTMPMESWFRSRG